MRQRHIDIKRIARNLLSIFIILIAFYFYFGEIENHVTDLRTFKITIDILFLLVALVISLAANIFEAVIWKSIIRVQIRGGVIGFREIIAILNASSLFRYLPGRIWPFAAQILWLKKYGFNKTFILFINILFIVETIILSLYLIIICSGIYYGSPVMKTAQILFILLICFNILFNFFSGAIANKTIAIISKFTKTEIQPLRITSGMMFTVQFLFTFSWALTGIAAYFAANGIGMNIYIHDIVPIVASMSLSGLAGFLSVFTPGGLGVREGVMLVMLKPIMAVQAALLLPILTRLMLVISETLLGLIGLFWGIRYKVYSFQNNDEQ